MNTELDAIQTILAGAERVVIIQADNPDADSLGSALALEAILADLGKKPYMYCAVDVPTYLRYLPGWARVHAELPHEFDASIVVDASTMTLLERLSNSGQQSWVASKACIVLDHHEQVDNIIPFASVLINRPNVSSTGELIYQIAKDINWPLPVDAREAIMTAILGDTQGLTNQLTSATTYRVMAELLEAGTDRAKLEDQRREASKMHQDIFKYKARLIDRTEFMADGKLALVTVPQEEINTYSPLYNPAPLIQGDMLQTQGVAVAIVLKEYNDGRVTAAIRCNPSAGIAAQLAEAFGGGGHAYASGFKITDGRALPEIKSECVRLTAELLAKLDEGNTDESLQYAYQTD